MNDYVGPSRNQLTPEMLAVANRYRAILPGSLFDAGLPRGVANRPVAEWLAEDASEAADSSAILPAIAQLLPDAVIVPLGGLIYYIALQGAYAHFDPECPQDTSLIKAFFELDKLVTAARPELTIYALAHWQKPPIA